MNGVSQSVAADEVALNPIVAGGGGGAAAAAAVAYKSYNELCVERRDNILIIRINRPEVRNALRRRTVYELLRAIDEGINAPTINVIVLTGNGATFTAGVDLTQIAQLGTGNELSQYLRSANFVLRSLVKKFIYCPKVLVALVNGDCIGLGFTLCALCDIVYCTEGANFWAPFTQLGLCMEACASWTFPQLFGRAKASELLLFGTRLNADDARAYNFVAEVLRADELESKFWPSLVAHGRLPAVSLRASKRLLMQANARDQLLEALRLECHELDKLRHDRVYLSRVIEWAKRAQRNKSKL